MNDFHSAVARLLASASPRRERAKALAELIRDWAGFHWVGLYDVSPTHISAIAWTGDQSPAFPSFPVSQGINGAAVAQRSPVIVQDVSQDHRYLTTFGATRAEAIFPVVATDLTRVLGTIDVESDTVNAFHRVHEAFLGECATLLKPLWE